MADRTKIDWCDASWNPVTGCLHGCEYCYARRIAERFAGCDKGSTYGVYCQATWRRVNPESSREEAIFEIDAKCPPINLRFDAKTQIMHTPKAPYPWGFSPTLHRDLMDVPQKWKKPRTIFVCSMSDLFGEWVPLDWIKAVFDACEAAPQHRYLFLTKNPNRYIELAEKDMLPRQHWYGYSATRENQLWRFHHADECPCINLFVSIEPILGPMQPRFSTHTPADWVIIGAETGNRKGKVIPEKKWINYILAECEYSGRPIFMKESLRPIMGDDFRQEFPW